MSADDHDWLDDDAELDRLLHELEEDQREHVLGFAIKVLDFIEGDVVSDDVALARFGIRHLRNRLQQHLDPCKPRDTRGSPEPPVPSTTPTIGRRKP